MTSARSSATSRYDFDELSGVILDKVGSADSSLESGVTYNAGNGVKSVTITAGKIEFNGGSKPLDATAPWTFWMKFKYKDVVDAVSRQPMSMAPNSFSPQMFWDDVVAATRFRFDTNNNGSTTLDLNVGREIQNDEIFCVAFSHPGGAGGTLNGAVKNKSTDINVSGSVAETGSAPVLAGLKLGAAGLDAPCDIEVFEVGVEQGTARSIADLQDTIDEVLAVGELIESVPTRRYSQSAGTPFGVGGVAIYVGDNIQELPGLTGIPNYGEGSPTAFTFSERRYSQSLLIEGNFEVTGTVSGEYNNRKFTPFEEAIFGTQSGVYYNNRRYSAFKEVIFSSSDIIYYNNRKYTVGDVAMFGVSSEFVAPPDEQTGRGRMGRRARVARGSSRFT